MDSGRLWGHGLIKRPGTVTFLVGETIPPGLKREDIEARVHAAINALELGAKACA
jgi:1-acyl-sn-glycerol-3-phosphate acyltransferase